MDDLISREKAQEIIPKVVLGVSDFAECIRDSVDSVFDNCPSAFEGMTNGDVMKAVYADSEICIDETYKTVEVFFGADGDYCEDEARFDLDWWNAPYKGVSE